MRTEEHEVPFAICPACNAEMGLTVSVGHDYAPKPGDASICAECATWCVFTDDLHLERMPDDERSKMLLRSHKAREAEWAVLELMNSR